MFSGTLDEVYLDGHKIFIAHVYLYVLCSHVKVPDGTRKVLMPQLNSKHEIFIGGCGECYGRWVSTCLNILSRGDGGEGEGIHYHAGEADDDGHYDPQRKYSSCKGTILILIFIPEHLSRVKEICHFHHFLEAF
jgi:hypothetical protein